MKVDKNQLIHHDNSGIREYQGGIPIRLELASRMVDVIYSHKEFSKDISDPALPKILLALADQLIIEHNNTCDE